MPELTGAVALVQLGRLDDLIATMRVHKQAIKEEIAPTLTRAGGSFRLLTDPNGDIGIALIFFMPTPLSREYIVQALNAEHIDTGALYWPNYTDYHVYAHWNPILAQRTWSPCGGPWSWGAPISYYHDMCQRTLDLLGRAVHIDINPLFTDADVSDVMAGLNKVLRSVANR